MKKSPLMSDQNSTATLTSFRRRDEMNGIGLLASIPRFLRKGVGDHGIFEKQPQAK